MKYRNNNKFPEKFLVKAIDSLQKVYSDDIKINTEELGNIKLSKIDLFARYSNQAYVNLEPSFPILTDDHLFDYGSILKWDGIKKNTLLLCLDSGTQAFESVEAANKENCDVIIIDHHQVNQNIPKSFALINPKRKKWV